MRGRNVIYYAEGFGPESYLLNSSEISCSTREEVMDLFGRYAEGYRVDRATLEQFDPFLDGGARDRIIEDMLGDREGPAEGGTAGEERPNG